MIAGMSEDQLKNRTENAGDRDFRPRCSVKRPPTFGFLRLIISGGASHYRSLIFHKRENHALRWSPNSSAQERSVGPRPVAVFRLCNLIQRRHRIGPQRGPTDTKPSPRSAYVCDSTHYFLREGEPNV